MSIYFIVLFLTITVLTSMKNLIPNIKERNLILTTLSALPLSILAGLRTTEIGTDIGVYGFTSFNLATSSSSFLEYWHLITIKYGTEIGYAWLNYVVSRFTSSLNVFLFVLSFCTLWFVIKGALNFEKVLHVPSEIQIIIYFSILYGTSLNMMRQSLAMSIIFFSTSLLVQKKKKYFVASLLLAVIAFLFHRTAIMITGIYLTYWYSVGISKTLRKKFEYFIFPWAVPLAVIGIPFLFKYFINNAIFSKYQMYLEADNWLGSTSKSISRIFLTTGPAISALLLVLVIFIAKTYFKLDQKKLEILGFLGIILLFDVFTQFTAISGQIVSRLGLYFTIFEIVAVPFCIQTFFSKYVSIFVYSVLIFYYLYIFYHLTILGTGQIYPYHWILH